MRRIHRLSLAAALLAGVATAALAAEGPQVEVMNWFTSGSETAAIKAMASAVDAAGGRWKNDAVAGLDQALVAANAAAAGGNPPTALQFNGGKQFDDLIDRGLLNDVDAVAAEQRWKEVLPEAILGSITKDGHFYAVPIDDVGEGWSFTSTAAFKKAGVEVPKSWDGFFPAMDKLKAAGIVPIAWGGQDWQEFAAFYVVLLSKEGPGLYNAVFRDHKVEAVRSPAFRDAVHTFIRMRDYVDAGSPNRNWNDATAMLINGTAGIQFMGDFVKGEFAQAHMQEGKDYSCMLGFGENDHYYIISTDVFVMPKGRDGAERAQAQNLLARVAMSKDTQVAFNDAKGALPARLDVDPAKLDPCARKGYAAMQDPANRISGPEIVLSADTEGALTDLVTRFWATPSMTEDAFIDKFADALGHAND